MTLALVLISLAAGPQAPTDARSLIFVPKLDTLGAIRPFFDAAGTRSGLLRPSTWRDRSHPLIDLDAADQTSLEVNGVDPSGPITRSDVRGFSVTCLKLRDVDAYRRACDARLAVLGKPFERTEGAVSVYGSKDPLDRVLGAYALIGKTSCAISGQGLSVEPQLAALAKTTAGTSSSPAAAALSKLPGVLQFAAIDGKQWAAAGITTTGLTLTVDGRAANAPFPRWTAGASPFAGFRPEGMLVLRGKLSREALGGLLSNAVRRFPFSTVLAPLVKALAPSLSGDVALVVTKVQVTSGLRTPEARFFALRGAAVLELSSPELAAAAISAIDVASLGSRWGILDLSIDGTHLLISNDTDAKARALAALKNGAGKLAHGLEVDVDPPLVARGLQQIPLLEAVQTPELAGLVAVGSELGPLLLDSRRISGWLDGTGKDQHSGRLVWTLDETAFARDAGP